jgi:hypothetical protein
MTIMAPRRTESEFVEFSWWIPEGGYEWRDDTCAGKKDMLLYPKDVAGFRRRGRRYLPLQESTGLFQTFARTERTPDGLLDFANRYGSIFGDQGRPESLWQWKVHLTRLRKAVCLWSLTVADNRAELARHIVWQDGAEGAEVSYEPCEANPDPDLDCRMGIAGPRFQEHWLNTFQQGDVVLPALVNVMGRVNARLRDQGSMPGSAGVAPELVYDERSGRLRLHIIPGNLLGAIWLQFAQAINGNKEYRQCAGCGKWFELSPDTARTSRFHCSDACRSRAYRERRERARVMRAQGKGIKAIAGELDSDVETVKNWVFKKRKG